MYFVVLPWYYESRVEEEKRGEYYATFWISLVIGFLVLCGLYAFQQSTCRVPEQHQFPHPTRPGVMQTFRR